MLKEARGDRWEQVEPLENYRTAPTPFQALPGGQRKAFTFVATSLPHGQKTKKLIVKCQQEVAKVQMSEEKLLLLILKRSRCRSTKR